jgi:hypothetical protein
LSKPLKTAMSRKKKEEQEFTVFNVVEEDGAEDVNSLLCKAIDIDQAIVGEAGLLQSDSLDSPTAVGSNSDPRVDLEARRIESKAMRQGQIINEVYRKLKQHNSSRKIKR